MHISYQTGQTKDVAALGHSRRDRVPEAYGAGCQLRPQRYQNLENIAPVGVYIGVNSLRMIIGSRIDYEAVVGMHVSSLIRSVVSGTKTPGRVSSGIAEVITVISIENIGRRRHGVIHEVSN